MAKLRLELKDVKIGDKVFFNPGNDPVGWDSYGYLNGEPISTRYGVYFPCWTKRQKGEDTTFMVHETNVNKIEQP
jgi:hypothetical protein